MNSLLHRALFLAGLSAALAARAADTPQRLVNLSTRAQVGTGTNAPLVGFVIGEGSPTKRVLVRAIGPGMTKIGMQSSQVNSNPRLVLNRVVNSTETLVAENRDWTNASVGGGQTVFDSVGAFRLDAGSRDAALIADISPGAYTAQVTGEANSNGLVLLEVYDITGAARLINLSTRAMVGTGSNIMISGLAIPGGAGTRKMLVRAIGPTLAAPPPAGFGLTAALADPQLEIYDSSSPGAPIARNDNWTTEHTAALRAAAVEKGAFPLVENSRDAAVIADLLPGRNYTIHVSGVGETTGIALIELYDLTPDNLPSVTVAATTATTDTKGAPPGVFTFTRTGATAAPLTVYYTLGGSAISGFDYTALPGTVTIPAGAASATVSVNPSGLTIGPAINKDAALTLASGPGYLPEAARSAAVTIFYNPGTLYITQLRGAPGTASTGYGVSTIQLSDDNTFAIVDLSFSNLSSAQTVAYLRLGNPGEVGIELLRLPNGQVDNLVWTIQPSGALSAADIVKAIKDGRVFVSIESASYPAGELRGGFIQSSGSQAFTPPAAAATLPDAALTAADASRFLAQATFGATKAEIDALTGKRAADLQAWIGTQMILPPTLLLDATRADFNAYTALAADNPQYSYQNRQAAWWKNALTAPDQLRQRVAFALSEIFVVSDVNSTLYNNPLGMANYYDLLVKGAFGNFRQVLEDVTLSPIMGFYLSSLRNRKAAGATLPDENYAREVMQLFTIGLNQLQPDGTLKLDALGLPIPTYDQKTITEMAKIFTGWAYYSTQANPSFTGAAANWIEPMMLYPAFHEDGAKTIVNGVAIAANQGGVKDLKDTLDALFQHPNTAPFISRQLIQRLVTSNPSPGYVYRVAQAFADNGAGVRGDLGAVVRAILADYEARSAGVAATASFGKLKEPVLRATALLRAFGGAANNGRYQHFVAQGGESNLGQTPLHAPSVFNYFEPDYIEPGLLASAGLYAPEYQILTDTTAISLPNQLWSWTYANRSTTDPANTTIGFNFDSSLLALARTPAALVAHVNLVLAGGGLPKAATDRITAALTAMPNNTAASDLERVRSAIYLTVTIPQGAIQK